MSAPTSQPDPFTAPVWQFRFLICRDRIAGQQMVTISGSKRRRTQFDAFHGCQAYLCEDYAEYDMLQRTVVGKTDKSFWGVVELYDPVTQARKKLADVPGVILAQQVCIPQSQAGQAAKSPGSYPGNAGSSPAPATTFEITTSPGGPAVDIVAGEESGLQSVADALGIAPMAVDSSPESFQTPGGSQSGGVVVEAAPCEPTGTLSDPPAVDADAGTPDPTASLTADASASPAPEPVSARAPASKTKPAAKKGKK